MNIFPFNRSVRLPLYQAFNSVIGMFFAFDGIRGEASEQDQVWNEAMKNLIKIVPCAF
jgi:hypothetical protein